MPGMLQNSYDGKASVPIHHSNATVHAALVNELADAKRDAMAYHVEWSQPALHKERAKTLGDTKTNNKYTRSKAMSKETNYTGLA